MTTTTSASSARRRARVTKHDSNSGHFCPRQVSGVVESCGQAPVPLVERLLADLSAGPSDDARAGGLSTAIPPDSRLTLSGIDAGTAEIEVETASAISADRLPGAVGQIVLTVTSVPGVTSVVLVSDGEPLQVPLPGGALSAGPVTDQDYLTLLPDRLQEPGIVGCARA